MEIVDNVVGRPNTKHKTRIDAIETIPMEQVEACTQMPELEGAKKCKGVESVWQSEKEAKIKQLAEICGVELPFPNRSKNFTSGSFKTCGTSWCREQYRTTKALFDDVAQTVLGLGMKDFVGSAMERLPAAQI